MQKILLISTVLFSSLMADSFLGTPIFAPKETTQQLQTRLSHHKSYQKTIPNEKPIIHVEKKDIYKSFREDDHRYDKRYRDFDYENKGYYNSDAYYYGYYDHFGYFYDNVYYRYNSRYTYYDRHHRRGYFEQQYPHHRTYQYHYINDWNRVHCYYEPGNIVYGHYYSPPYETTTITTTYYEPSPYHYHEPIIRRNVTIIGEDRRENYRYHNHRYGSINSNHYREDNHYRRPHTIHRDVARMRTRNSINRIKSSPTHRKHTTHMQLSK